MFNRIVILLVAALAVAACQKDNGGDTPSAKVKPSVQEYDGQWYAGGVAGTVFNATSRAYRQPMDPVNDNPFRYRQFMRGEEIFGKSFVSEPGTAYSGLGPAYIRKSCLACHPSYGGRSKRVDKYDSGDSRNGYLLMIYDPSKPGLPLATQYFTGMTQTRAVAPFKAPVDEKGITITWKTHVDQHGNRYEDGTPYSAGTEYAGTLIYPVVTIAQDAILFPDFDMSAHRACIEATIGIYGTGLLDAISDEDLRAEHQAQQTRGYAAGVIGADIDETGLNLYYPGKHPGRFTYLCTRATLDNGPGSNALWNITNVTRPDRRYNYITERYARLMSQDDDVQAALSKSETEIFDELMSKSLPSEMSRSDYNAFMVWHRALAVPAARNLDDPQVQRGRELFAQAGCAACHRPSWTTRENYKPMPELSNQKIWPYTDLLRHDLERLEPGRAQVCRTTPLWGRGLMKVVSGHSDMLHDLRARNYEEAIVWHGGQAEKSKQKFRSMSADDRAALISFLEAI